MTWQFQLSKVFSIQVFQMESRGLDGAFFFSLILCFAIFLAIVKKSWQCLHSMPKKCWADDIPFQKKFHQVIPVQVSPSGLKYLVYPISSFKTFQKIWCFQWVFHDWALRESEGLLSVPNYGIVSSRQAAGDILRRKRVFFRAWQWALGGREEGGPGIQSRLSQTSSYLSLVGFYTR